MKDKTIVVVPTSSDTISKIIDSAKGRYSVLVTRDSFPSFAPLIIDTLGVDTIEVLRAIGDSISVLNYTLAFAFNQQLVGSEFYFAYSDYSQYAAITRIATFFLANDSIEFWYGSGGYEWGTYFFYRGKKI